MVGSFCELFSLPHLQRPLEVWAMDIRCKQFSAWVLAIATASLILPTGAHAGVVLGQIDDFQDGTLANWTNGPGAPDPVNITTGGPAGSGDRFLQVTSTGGTGAGSRLVVFNQVQWSGNYTAAGVTLVEMDLKNFTTSTLSMRIGFISGTVGKGSPGLVSNAFSLAADGNWHHAVYALDSTDLNVIGSTSISSVLASVSQFRILDATGLSLDGDVIAGQFGADNIHAGPSVPEPSSLALVGASLFGFSAAAWRKRRLKATGSTSGSAC
jgi:PEP-CTERM motif